MKDHTRDNIWPLVSYLCLGTVIISSVAVYLVRGKPVQSRTRGIQTITSASNATPTETMRNKEIVRRAFDEWTAGGTKFFDVLDENVEWTIAGSGRSAKTFRGRQAFLEQASRPIADRWVSGIRPKVRGLYADGDEVVIHWDGAVGMKDGQIYQNSYAWFFQMRAGKAVKVTAFLDLPTYDAALDGRPLPQWPAR